MFTILTSVFNAKLKNEGEAQAVVVVPVVGIVVVAIRDTAVARVVVPATAAENAVRASCSCRNNPPPQTFGIAFHRIREQRCDVFIIFFIRP